MGMNHTRHMALGEGRWDVFSRAVAPPTVWADFVDATPTLRSVRMQLRRTAFDAPGNVQTVTYIAIAILWAAALAYSVREYRRHKAEETVEAIEADLRKPEEETTSA